MSAEHSNKVNSLFMWVDKICRGLFRSFCHIIRIVPMQTTEDALVQFVKFGIVGVTNTAVSYITYAISLVVLKQFGLNGHYGRRWLKLLFLILLLDYFYQVLC